MYIDFSGCSLKSGRYDLLDSISLFLKKNPGISLKIVLIEYIDWRISMRYFDYRAEAIKDYIVDRGIEAKRLIAEGHEVCYRADLAEGYYLVPNNRILEFIIIEIDKTTAKSSQ